MARARKRSRSSAIFSVVTSSMIVTAAIAVPCSSRIAADFSMFHLILPLERWTVRISSGSASPPPSRRTEGMSAIVSSRPFSSCTMYSSKIDWGGRSRISSRVLKPMCSAAARLA